jgi:hypothetical protein
VLVVKSLVSSVSGSWEDFFRDGGGGNFCFFVGGLLAGISSLSIETFVHPLRGIRWQQKKHIKV